MLLISGESARTRSACWPNFVDATFAFTFMRAQFSHHSNSLDLVVLRGDRALRKLRWDNTRWGKLVEVEGKIPERCKPNVAVSSEYGRWWWSLPTSASSSYERNR